MRETFIHVIMFDIRSTIGHPLSDLANMLLPWYFNAGLSEYTKDIGIADHPRPLPFIPEAEELIEYYCQLRNKVYPLDCWDFCRVFAIFRVLLSL